jgi:hypothetical protein
LEAKIIVPIVASITIISLAIVLVIVPIMLGKEPCTVVETPAGKFQYCQGKPPVLLEQNVPANDTSLPPTPEAPTSVNEIPEPDINVETPLSLDSITGNWNVQGQTREGLQFFGAIIFGQNNQFSALFYANGVLQQVQYGTYNYSPSEQTLTLTYYGQNPNFYNVKDITQNSFNIEGTVGTATFVRA